MIVGNYLFSNYARKPFEIMEGDGCYVTDNQGKTYLDFTSGIGVMNLGYNQPKLNQVLAEQAQKIWHTPNLYDNHLQEIVAEKLIQDKDYLAFFCNSGAEANEAAIKLARKATGKSQIITFTNSFHGRTYGAMSATGQPSIHAGFEPLVPGFVYVPYNDFASLEAEVTDQTAAIMLELIQGEGGVTVADSEWIQQIATLCQEKNILLVIDEVQTGIGRTGSLFAFEQFQVTPDIFTLAKGLGNGFPVGAMLGKTELGEHFGPGSHGTTFGGNKLGMAVASEILEQLSSELLVASQQRSQQLFSGLAEIKSDKIREIRGKGLMIGIELDPEVSVNDILEALEIEGLLALRAGTNTLRLLPPLTISEAEITLGVEKLKKVFTK
ncbi:acetylornithine transaminase [Enterococcus saccharolyticus]|uniref:acetylornithine transaminase n=1 Tax=Enterococcus saccharolyticus TaxID=41997 RepID=UPI0039E14210